MQVNRSGDSILYRSEMNAKIKRNFQVFSACDFIAAARPSRTSAKPKA
jgi:hypothetical protein